MSKHVGEKIGNLHITYILCSQRGITPSKIDAMRRHSNLICSTLKQSHVQNFSSICQSMYEKSAENGRTETQTDGRTLIDLLWPCPGSTTVRIWPNSQYKCAGVMSTPKCLSIIAMHSLCCCSIPLWRRSSLKKGPLIDVLWPCSGSAPRRIWNKSEYKWEGSWVLYPYEVWWISIKWFCS